MEIVIPGVPVGKARPRFSMGRAYSPQSNKSYESEIAKAFEFCNGRKLEGPLLVEIDAYYIVTTRDNKATKEAKLANFIRPTKKPDIDNIIKIVLDGLNGLAYGDDSQVVAVVGRKWYSAEPRVEVVIRECESNGLY